MVVGLPAGTPELISASFNRLACKSSVAKNLCFEQIAIPDAGERRRRRARQLTVTNSAGGGPDGAAPPAHNWRLLVL
jgi:hypothetical protein